MIQLNNQYVKLNVWKTFQKAKLKLAKNQFNKFLIKYKKKQK